MKNIYLTALAFIGLNAFAQTDIKLKINHLLDGNSNVFNTTSQNNLGHEFELNRVEYYLSQFTIYHDGGTATAIDDFWVLANANDNGVIELGNYGIQEIDSISFGVGVEQSANHLDPSTYDASHPLAHQNPSMHWGWSAGYRFAALEGLAGTSALTMEFHSLGDANYMMQTVVLNESAQDGALTIYLDAEYANAFDDIDLTNGVIVHGETGKAVTLLQNFQNGVFSAGDISSSVAQINPKSNAILFPNPVSGDQLYFSELVNDIKIYNLQGRLILNSNQSANWLDMSMLEPGQYLIYAVDLNGYSINKSIIIL